MRLKEIKPNTAIHCTSKEQIRCLIDVGIASENYAKFDVPIWICFYGDRISSWMPEVDSRGIRGKNYYEEKGIRGVEFSDLIIPELTAEELLDTINEICENNCCNDMCALSDENGCIIRKAVFDKKHVIEACIQWKSDHEKKEPEIETVDICRIIEIQPDGRKMCVHEEDIKPDSDMPYGYERDSVNAILKRYCMEHDGEYIAVHEVVSRVKAVE